MISKYVEIANNEYIVDIDISVQEWEVLLQNKKVFTNNCLGVIHKFYLEPNHRATSKYLGTKYNCDPRSIFSPITHLGKRIVENLNRFTVHWLDGSVAYTPICMKIYKKGNFGEFQLRDELLIAIKNLNLFGHVPINIKKDDNLDINIAEKHTYKKNKNMVYDEDTTEKIYTERINNEYFAKINISISEWETLLQDKTIFTRSCLNIIHKFYLEPNCMATSKYLAVKYNCAPQSIFSPISHLGKRIIKELNRFALYGQDGKKTYAQVCVKIYKQGEFYQFQLREELITAIKNLNLFEATTIDIRADNELITSLAQDDFHKTNVNISYSQKPKQKEEIIVVNNQKYYRRDKNIAKNAIVMANYKCEVNNNHPTFLRKNFDINYTEPHHLVPLKYYDDFSVSLDVEENIVSLCSNCHNQLHYGKDTKEILNQLFNKRKKLLKSVGINITLNELITFYN